VVGDGNSPDFALRSKSPANHLFTLRKCRIRLSFINEKESLQTAKNGNHHRHYGNKWQYQNSVQFSIHLT